MVKYSNLTSYYYFSIMCYNDPDNRHRYCLYTRIPCKIINKCLLPQNQNII